MIKYIFGLFFLKFQNFKNHCIYSIYIKKYNINNTFRFNGDGIILYGDGKIIIGDNTYIGGWSTIKQ